MKDIRAEMQKMIGAVIKEANKQLTDFAAKEPSIVDPISGTHRMADGCEWEEKLGYRKRKQPKKRMPKLKRLQWDVLSLFLLEYTHVFFKCFNPFICWTFFCTFYVNLLSNLSEFFAFVKFFQQFMQQFCKFLTKIKKRFLFAKNLQHRLVLVDFLFFQGGLAGRRRHGRQWILKNLHIST